MSTIEKEPTVLDRMKEIEAKKEKAKTLKVLNILKELAKQVQEDKERCSLYLQEICKSEKEQKQIIDWINNLEDVQVQDERCQDLKEEVRKTLSEEKKRIEKKVNDEPEKFFGNFVGYSQSAVLANSNCVTTGTTATNAVGSSLNLAGNTFTNTSAGLQLNG